MDNTAGQDKNRLMVYVVDGSQYVTSSYCGYCDEDLSKGAFIGDKIICKNCGSSFCVKNGFVEDGPSLRNILSFPVHEDKLSLQVLIPINQDIPKYRPTKVLP